MQPPGTILPSVNNLPHAPFSSVPHANSITVITSSSNIITYREIFNSTGDFGNPNESINTDMTKSMTEILPNIG